MEKLFLIDAFALIFKFYYALIGRPMRNNSGLNTSAIYGFTRFINDIIKNECPHNIAVAFDPSGGNFRHEIFPKYKANRSATPEDIKLSIPYIKEILNAMNIPILEVAGYEADDVIGTMAKKASKKGYVVYMVTPDKDYGQLIEENIYMYKPGKSGSGVEIMGVDELKDKYKIESPSQIIDLLALWGDVADNVPGIPGVGEKTAIKLLQKYGNIDNILEDCENLKGKMKENFMCNKEQLILSRELVTICLDVPIESNFEDMQISEPNVEELCRLYKELNFTTLKTDLLKGCDFGNEMPQREIYSKRKDTNINNSYQHNVNNVNNSVDNSQPTLFSGQPSLFDMPQGKGINGESTFEASTTLFDSIEELKQEDINSYKHTYTLIDNSNIDMLIEGFSKCKEFCFDTETTGVNAVEDELVGISLCKEKGIAYYLPLLEKEESDKMLEKLKPLFRNKDIAKIGQNMKFDIMMLNRRGVEIEGLLYDTMILHYLINSDERHNMDFLSQKYLNYIPVPISSLIGKGSKQLSMADIDLDRVVEYASEDADVTFQLKEILWKESEKYNTQELYLTIEEPLIKVLCEMELNGVKIDVEELYAYSEILKAKLSVLEATIIEMTGIEGLNVNSPKQLGIALFEKLKISDKPKRTKTKQYKTDEEYLTSLIDKHEVIGVILEYRGLKKLLSTYVLSLPELINKKTGRIHTSYNQTVTTTGRLSSSNPNLQNIPIRTKEGKRIRKCFVASDEDHELLAADYSQVELRIMAHLSQDMTMIEAFNSGEDIHTKTASKIYDIELSEVTSDQRRNAKTANFGIIYGISVHGLSQRLDISYGEAKKLIDGYFKTYPRVAQYMQECIEKAREKGYTETIYHRKRYLEDINSRNSIVRGYAERNAINAPIQGSAADIIKIAMARLYEKLKGEKLDCKIILQVHDELIIEVAKKDCEKVKNIVKEAMENSAQLSIPLLVETGNAFNWLDAH
ncbi:MAG: DNA polymerase I [Bacteroidetes bacterium]|nr:DNA polymerase I [Bacteroidota bacterium]